MAVKQLKVESLRIDGGTQLRAKIDQATVEEYRAGWVNDVKFPALVVFFDGTDYWLADGFHRFHGASAACVPTVPCDVRTGTQRDAILFAAGANQTNGLRRSNEDKRKAVRTLLEDKEWGKRTNAWVAEQCGVSDMLVADVRDQGQELDPGAAPEKRTGRDGKEYTVPAKKPEKPILNDPALPQKKKPPGGNNFNPSDWEGEPEAEPEKTKEAESLDGEGNPIPAKLKAIFARSKELLDLERALQAVAKKLDDSQEDPLYAFIHVQSTTADIDNAKRAIRFAKPHATCPYCKGAGKTCKACKGLGWVPKQVFKQAPSEMRA
jgi:hypothetical protein